MTRPFRFGVNLVTFRTGEEWLHSCRRAEELGYDVLHVPDHLGMPAPFTALAAAAGVTRRVRLGTFVLNAGLWNPALLAREAATCDQLTGGRLELGLGAGYVRAEHGRAGLPFGSPGERAGHLEQTVHEVIRLFADPGHAPQPAQHPLPLMIGGNGRRVLRLAAAHAQTVAFTGARQAPGKPDGTLQLISPHELDERVATYREFTPGHGGAPPELHYLVQQVTADGHTAVREAAAYGAHLSEDELLGHPALLTGDPAQIAAQLTAHRERYGFSFFTVHAPYMEAFAPVIELLHGR